ncbi:MAG: type II toxin-antitoxin system RelE/ParE family toxin [Nitrospirae bacterium]|nr:type II toxin-antitoxin system RelE/ParE family toxin [Nitrospirota bacterium]MBI5097597.1 type II toxin-antitoxin system RelE/ParE family toxin [Nitrospirota bacterium]
MGVRFPLPAPRKTIYTAYTATNNSMASYYNRQDKDTKQRLNKCVANLSKDPLFGPHIKRLHGELQGKYRYEMGGLRVVYEVNTKNKTIEIKSIGSRGEFTKGKAFLLQQ